MPPEGYESVTLPTELVEAIDETTHMDRQATLRLLLSQYNSDGDGEVGITPEEYADLMDRVASAESAAKAAEEQVTGLRRELGSGGHAGVGGDVR